MTSDFFSAEQNGDAHNGSWKGERETRKKCVQQKIPVRTARPN